MYRDNVNLHLTATVPPSLVWFLRYGQHKSQVNVTTARSNQGHTMALSTNNPPNQCPYQVSTSYVLQFLRHTLEKILKVNVTTVKSKVKSRSHHDVQHLRPPNNVPTKFQLPTLYGFQDIAQTRPQTQSHYSKVKS